jgi:hypothetical protein
VNLFFWSLKFLLHKKKKIELEQSIISSSDFFVNFDLNSWNGSLHERLTKKKKKGKAWNYFFFCEHVRHTIWFLTTKKLLHGFLHTLHLKHLG